MLQVSALPPHAVTVQPESGVIVIAASHPELQQNAAVQPPPQASQAGQLQSENDRLPYKDKNVPFWFALLWLAKQ